MAIRTRATEMFGMEHPIFAFSVHKEVVAAVTNAGGFGVLGALRFSPDELDAELTWIDKEVNGKPYGVDVVMPASYAGADIGDTGQMLAQLQEMIPEEHRRFVEETLAGHGVPPLPPEEADIRGLLGWTDVTARPQVDVSLSHPIRLLANALGPPPEDVVEEAHRHGVPVAALVGSAKHARKQVDVGVDIIVAQGTEAAGHCGEIAAMVLIPEVVDAVHPAPVLAAGGIGTGRQMAAGLALGAEGAWTGSVWLTVEEADLSPLVKQKLLDADSKSTVRTRAWTGKPARLLRTAWTDAWDEPENPKPLQMPLQWLLTAEAQHRMFKYEREAEELVGMPVGQIVGKMTEILPSSEVIRRLATECEDTLTRLRELSGERVSQR